MLYIIVVCYEVDVVPIF